jgi:hypothetical protein
MTLIRQAHPDLSSVPKQILLSYPNFAANRQGELPDVFWLAEPLAITLFSGRMITIPAGFPTDGASVPRWLQGLFPAIGDHLLADVIHDYLYTTNLLPRADCDLEFWRWMDLLRPLAKSRLDNRLRYQAVHRFGEPYYRKYSHLAQPDLQQSTNSNS